MVDSLLSGKEKAEPSLPWLWPREAQTSEPRREVFRAPGIRDPGDPCHPGPHTSEQSREPTAEQRGLLLQLLGPTPPALKRQPHIESRHAPMNTRSHRSPEGPPPPTGKVSHFLGGVSDSQLLGKSGPPLQGPRAESWGGRSSARKKKRISALVQPFIPHSYLRVHLIVIVDDKLSEGSAAFLAISQ